MLFYSVYKHNDLNANFCVMVSKYIFAIIEILIFSWISAKLSLVNDCVMSLYIFLLIFKIFSKIRKFIFFHKEDIYLHVFTFT